MGFPDRARRAFVVALVLALHAGMWLAFVEATRQQVLVPAPDTTVSTLLLLARSGESDEPPAAPRTSAQALLQSLPVSRSRDLQGVTPELILPDIQPPPRVNWAEAAQAVASRAAEAPHQGSGEAGPSPASAVPPVSMLPMPLHHNGQQVRTDNGGFNVWINDHCYLAERVPIPNVPEHLINPIPVCHRGLPAPVPASRLGIQRALDARIPSTLP